VLQCRPNRKQLHSDQGKQQACTQQDRQDRETEKADHDNGAHTCTDQGKAGG
jgi:hypothetical protein